MKTSRGGISRVVWAEALGVVLILLALYGCTISANLCIAHDSIHYINTIDDGRNLYHPHHLLYAPVARLWVLTWRGLGAESVDSAALVASLNAVFGALTCGLVFVFCRTRLNLGRGQSLAGAGLAASSFGMWYYSVCVEVYVIPAFWLLVTLLILTRRRLGIGSCVAMGLTCGLAVLFHQTNVLFGLFVVTGVATAVGRPVRWRLLAIAAFIGTGMIVTCVPYAIVLLIFVEADSWSHAWHWLTDYAQGSQWGAFTCATLPKAAIGFARSIVGGHFLFASPLLASTVDRFLGSHHLADERFLVRHMPAWQAWAYLATGVTACVFVVLAVGRGLLGRLRGLTAEAPTRRLLVILVGWLVVYAVFFAWWEPENLEFWIAPSLAFWMSVLTVLSRAKRGWRLLAGAMVLLLATNLFGSILRLRSRDNDYHYHRIQPLAEAVREGDAIVVGRRWIWGDYLQRYTPAEVWCISDDARAGDASGRLSGTIESTLAGGYRVFVTADAAGQGEDARREQGDISSNHEPLWERYRLRWRTFEKQGCVFYVIEPDIPHVPWTRG
ncbi:MAG: hypothetical protein ABII12_02045 [Planctomycetota bacterium]